MKYDRTEKIMIGAFWTIMLTVLALITWVIYAEITEPDAGTITELEYSSAYTTVQCSSTGRTTTCIPISHPECYGVTYVANGKVGGDCMDRTLWESLSIGGWYEKN